MIGGPQYLNRMAYLAHPDRIAEEREAAEAEQGEQGTPAVPGEEPDGA